MREKSLYIFLLGVSTLGLSSLTKADITELRALDFGEVAIISNASIQELRMDYLGNISVDPAIRIIRRGQPAIYRASGFAGNVQLFVTTSILNSTMNPGQVSGEYPRLTALSAPASVFTLANGTADIGIGGTVSTSGLGSLAYFNGAYSSNIRVTINF